MAETPAFLLLPVDSCLTFTPSLWKYCVIICYVRCKLSLNAIASQAKFCCQTRQHMKVTYCSYLIPHQSKMQPDLKTLQHSVHMKQISQARHLNLITIQRPQSWCHAEPQIAAWRPWVYRKHWNDVESLIQMTTVKYSKNRMCLLIDVDCIKAAVS